MATPRPPGSTPPVEYEEIEFVRPDGTIEIFEFEVGTPDAVIKDVFTRYGAELSGQQGAPSVPEVGGVTDAQGALSDLDRAVPGGAPAPAPEGPREPGIVEKIITTPSDLVNRAMGATYGLDVWDYLKYFLATPRRGMEELETPEGRAEARQGYADLLSAPSRGLGMVLSGGMEDLGAADRAPAARALEAGIARAGSFVPAAAGVVADLIPGGTFRPAAEQFYETSQDIQAAGAGIPIEGPRSVFDVDSPEAMGQWMENVFAEQAPIIAGMVGAGMLGGPAAIFPFSMAMESGIIAQQQMEASGQVDPFSAAAGGVVAGALEAAPIMSWLKRTSLADDAMNWVGSRARSALIQTGQEMPTEYAQEIVEALATEFVAANQDRLSGREWEEALRVIKETQHEAIGAAAAAGVIGPMMGAMGGGDMGPGLPPTAALNDIFRYKLEEARQAGQVAAEMRGPEILPRSIQDLIAATRQQAPAAAPPIEAEVPPAPVEAPAPEALPAPPPGPRWTNDPGAMPGEPEFFLDNGKAAITEVDIEGKPNRYAATTNQGELIGEFDTLQEAAMAAVEAFPLEEEAAPEPEERRGPERAEIPPGIRGDEEARLKALLREGRPEEAEAFAGEIVRRAETDTLTGLRNQGAHQRAVEAAPEGSRHVYLDLDDFKEVNDTLGHEAGDEALRQAAAIIEEETAGIEGFEGFRRGGDEFAILAGANTEQLEDMMARIRQRIAEIPVRGVREDGSVGTGKVGTSYGIGGTLEEADAALYRDKEGKAERRAARERPEPEAEREPRPVGEAVEEARPEREVRGRPEEVVEPEPEREIPEPLAEPDDQAIDELTRLWQRDIIDNPDEVLGDEEEREEFVGRIHEILFANAVRGRPAGAEVDLEVGKALAELNDRVVIQIAKDAYEGKEARATLPLPLEEVEEEPTLPKKVTGQAFISRMRVAKTIEDLDKVMEQAHGAGVGNQRGVQNAYRRIKAGIEFAEGAEERAEATLEAAAERQREEREKRGARPPKPAVAVEEEPPPKPKKKTAIPLPKAVTNFRAAIEKAGRDVNEIESIRNRIHTWYDLLEREKKPPKHVREAYLDLLERVVAANEAARKPLTGEEIDEAVEKIRAEEAEVPEKPKRVKPKVPTRTVNYTAGVIRKIFHQWPNTSYTEKELNDVYVKIIAGYMSEEEANAALGKLMDEGVVKTRMRREVGESVIEYYVTSRPEIEEGPTSQPGPSVLTPEELSEASEIGRAEAAPETAEVPEPEPEAPAEPAPEVSERQRQDTELLKRLRLALIPFEDGMTRGELFDLADEVYGGTRAEGAYQESDVYDVLEAALNDVVFEGVEAENVAKLQHIVKTWDEMSAKVPKQPARTEKRADLQQFSTPPSYAAIVAWLANISNNDVVLEPSAGTGNIAAQAAAYDPARVIGNEIDDARANLLRQLEDVDEVYQFDADHLHALLHDRESPTVVVMNPPFSRDVKKKGKRQIHVGMRHVVQAVKLLPEGGRVVAIVGGGMANAGPEGGAHHKAPGYKRDFEAIRDAGGYLKANVRVPGSVYATHGTAFHTRVLIIDKLPEGEQLLIGKSPISQEVENLEELTDILREVRNERVHPAEVPKPPAREGGRPSPEEVGAEAEEGPARDVDVTPVPPGRVGRPATGEEGLAPGVSPTARGEEPAGGVQRTPTDDEAAVGGPAVEERPEEVEPGRAGERPGGRAPRRPTEPGQRVQDRGHDALRVDRLEKTGEPLEEDQGDIFASYAPTVAIEGAKEHPTPLSESLIMGTIDLPEVDYVPDLPKKVIESGAISAAQLEPIVYAGAAHSEMLPDGETRKGFFVGDGTGVGKTRVIGGVILDNWRQGRRRAVVLSPDMKLWDDFKEESAAIGLPKGALFKVGKMGEPIKRKEGILYITYATLVGVRAGKGDQKDVSRLQEVLDWLGEDFDGVVAFDEAHLMGNSMAEKMRIGTRKPSKRGIAGWKLQQGVPNARVLYASATGATEIRNLAFGARLGLWGAGTPFASRDVFVNEMVKGGLSAMEVVAQDMKRLGLYIARNLVLDVEYERLTHPLTSEQQAMYDRVAEAWQVILANVEKALISTGQVTVSEDGSQRVSQAARSARSRFYGDQQRFFNNFLASMKVPTLIKAMEADLAVGHSPVVQVKHTGEAALNRVLAHRPSSEQLQDLEVDSMGIVLHYLESAFPVKKYEEYTDEEGVPRTREVINPETGEAVLDPEAVRIRDRLMEDLASMKMPEMPLDQIINHFGAAKVAEVTGRSKRRTYNPSKKRWEIEKRTQRHATSDRNAFMDGKKPILVFSMDAGGTGHSYHASTARKNQNLRRHYVLEGGWRADQAIQALGRTHRSGQKQAPVWILVETNLAGEKRFVSTVARRLQQLGALTKGSREASGQELYSEMDNLETEWAAPALNAYFRSLARPESEMSLEEFERITGLSLTTPQGGLKSEGSMPDVPKFMNRVLALPLEQQNQVFEGFMTHYEMAIAEAKQSGEYDVGTETVKADKARVESEETVYSEGAAQSRYVQVVLSRRNNPVPFDDVPNFVWGIEPKFYKNERSGNIWVTVAERESTHRQTGNVVRQYRIMRPDRSMRLEETHKLFGKTWKELTGAEAETEWNRQAREVPEFRESTEHYVTGALIPIWDRFGEGARVEIERVRLDDGRVILGRRINPLTLKATLKRLGAGQKKIELTGQELFDSVLNENNEVTLANGWRIAKRWVRDEARLEVIGPDWQWNTPLREMGVLLEQPSGYKMRYFIPTDKTKGPKVADKVLAGQTIQDVSNPSERGISGDDGDFTDHSSEFYSMIDPLGGLMRRLSQAFQARDPQLNPIFVPPELRHEVPAIEERKAAARRGAVEETTREKAKKAGHELRQAFGSTFEYLDADESATSALTVDTLRQYRASPQFGRAAAYDTIRNITEGLDAERMILFTDYLALGDIIKDVEQGLYDGRKELPFGYSHRRLGEYFDPGRDIEVDYARVRRMVEANPEVMAAIERRQTFQRQLTRKLVEKGILRPEVLSDPRYYHRQVLEHLNARKEFPLGATAGVDVHMRKKSFQRKRAGGSDFNLAYHEAEYEYLAQAVAQIAKVEVLERLKTMHDKVPELKQLAKQRNRLLAEAQWAAGMNIPLEEARAHWLLHPTEHPTWYYRSRIAIASQNLGALASRNQLYAPGWEHVIEELGDSYLAWQEENEASEEAATFTFDHPQWFQFLSELAAQQDPDIEDNPGPIWALSIFKNIRQREQMIKGTLGRRYATWRTLARDLPGHTTWQPQEGRHFFFGHTISDKILDQVLAGEKLLQEEDVRDMLIVGGPKETWVIPEGLAATLDEWGPRDEGRVEDAAKWLLSSWKQWVLLNPLRAVKYNFNNMSGDLDIVLAYDPRILKYFNQAAADLWAHQVTGKASRAVSSSVRDAMKRGVVDSGLTIYEIPDIKKTGAFRALVATKDPNAFQKAAEGYWHGVRNLTTWRENILRLAAYRYFKDRIAAGETRYGASNRMQIDAIENADDRAAKLARELVGDYGNISTAGQWLRTHLFPFYSWLEINAPRYVRLMRNLPHEGRSTRRGAAVAAGVTARKAAIFAIKAHILFGAVMLWNRLMFPDEDKALHKNRRQLHLILGRRKDGTIISVRFEGALSDALEWFGLEDYPHDVRDFMAGKKDVLDIVSEAGKAPINRLIQSWEPFSKTTFEIILGRSSFPSFFEEGKSWKPRTRPIRNRWEHLTRTVSMDWLVRKVSRATDKPIPKRPQAEIPGVPPQIGAVLDSVLFYRTDPGEAAYWHARDLVIKWQKKHGDEMPSITPTERGNALYYHRKALVWGDEKAADAWLKRYVKLGGKAENYGQSIKRQHPLGSLSRIKKQAFVGSLTDEEVEEVKAAIRWYEKVYGGGRKTGVSVK